MSRRIGSTKQGIFTQTQYSALASVVNRSKYRLQNMRLDTVKLKKDECLPLFIKPEDRDVLMTAKSMITDDTLQYLQVSARAAYTSPLLADPVTAPVKFIARTTGLSFMVPDYANGRRSGAYVEPEEPLPTHLQRYVDGRLSLAVEFGLLSSMVKWFAGANLRIAEMAYMFPPIIQMFSQDPALKKLAEKHRTGAPVYVPTPPGAREMFSLVENTLVKTLLMEDKAVTTPEIVLDVRFLEPNIKLMGWDIALA